MTNQEYDRLVQQYAPKSPKFKDFLLAYVVGGGICALGQVLFYLYSQTQLTEELARAAVSVTLIFIAAVLTGIGVFDKIAKHAGAGTLVPITGFSNAMVSPAIEYRAEGWVLGVGAKLFTIAGPVIVYGTVASVIYGVIYWVTTLF